MRCPTSSIIRANTVSLGQINSIASYKHKHFKKKLRRGRVEGGARRGRTAGSGNGGWREQTWRVRWQGLRLAFYRHEGRRDCSEGRGGLGAKGGWPGLRSSGAAGARLAGVRGARTGGGAWRGCAALGGLGSAEPGAQGAHYAAVCRARALAMARWPAAITAAAVGTREEGLGARIKRSFGAWV